MFRLIIGVIGLFATYAYRPPTGFWDAVTMETQGRAHFLKPPVYYSALAVFALIALFGFVAMIRPKSRDDDY